MPKQEIAGILHQLRTVGVVRRGPNPFLVDEPLPPHDTPLRKFCVSQLDFRRRLGGGACGTVAAATFKGAPANSAPVAVKFTKRATADESTLIYREAAFMACVPPSAYIPQVYGVLAFDENPEYAIGFLMQLTGPSLESLAEGWRASGNPPTPTQLAGGFIGSAGALAGAHAAGVLHGDIKPANFLRMWDRWEFMLGDWGFAQCLQPRGPGSAPKAGLGAVAYR